jgi:hypothetical protein
MKAIYFLFVALSECSHSQKPGVKKGHCPYLPGELKTEISSSLDHQRISGAWINLFENKSVNERLTCYGSKLVPDVEHPTIFEYH